MRQSNAGFSPKALSKSNFDTKANSDGTVADHSPHKPKVGPGLESPAEKEER
jgi:hypothetical protein